MTYLTKYIFRVKTKMTESMYNLSNADIEVSSKIKPSLKFNKILKKETLLFRKDIIEEKNILSQQSLGQHKF